jgi:hypothetical protein
MCVSLGSEGQLAVRAALSQHARSGLHSYQPADPLPQAGPCSTCLWAAASQVLGGAGCVAEGRRGPKATLCRGVMTLGTPAGFGRRGATCRGSASLQAGCPWIFVCFTATHSSISVACATGVLPCSLRLQAQSLCTLSLSMRYGLSLFLGSMPCTALTSMLVGSLSHWAAAGRSL